MLSEISQIKKDKYYMISLIWESKNKQTNKNKFIDTENRLVVARGRGWRVGEMGKRGQKVKRKKKRKRKKPSGSCRESREENTVTTQVRGNTGSDQGGSNGRGKQW